MNAAPSIISTTRTASTFKTYNASLRERSKIAAIDSIRSKGLKGKFLRNILENADTDKRDLREYVRNLQSENISDEDFLSAMQEGQKCVDLLKPEVFQKEVQTMLSMNWLDRNDNIILEYRKFVIDILSAHNKYVMFAIPKLVSYWLPADDDSEKWTNGIPNENVKKKLENVHDTIGDILDVIPLTLDEIIQVIEESFPYFTKPSHIYAGYVYNIFQLLKYCPKFTTELITLLFKR